MVLQLDVPPDFVDELLPLMTRPEAEIRTDALTHAHTRTHHGPCPLDWGNLSTHPHGSTHAAGVMASKAISAALVQMGRPAQDVLNKLFALYMRSCKAAEVRTLNAFLCWVGFSVLFLGSVSGLWFLSFSGLHCSCSVRPH